MGQTAAWSSGIAQGYTWKFEKSGRELDRPVKDSSALRMRCWEWIREREGGRENRRLARKCAIDYPASVEPHVHKLDLGRLLGYSRNYCQQIMAQEGGRISRWVRVEVVVVE